MNRIYRYRLYPNQKQAEIINKTFGCVRFVFNKMLEDRKAAWEKYKDDPAALKAHRYPLPAAYKESRPWLKEVDSLALANAYLHLEAAYRKFFKKDGGSFPKFKSKRRSKTSYTTNNQRDSVRIEDGKSLRLPKVGAVKIKLHREPPAGAKIKSATVVRTESGRYYAAVLLNMEIEEPAPLPAGGPAATLDCPPGWLYRDGTGGGERLPAYLLRTQRRLREAKKKLKNKQAGGRNFLKQKKEITRLRERAAEQKRDFLHKASRRITNAWEAVTIKETRGEKKTRAEFRELKKLLAYKLKEQGKRLLTAKEENVGTRGTGSAPDLLSGVA
jgi:putative transposase